MPVDMYMYMYVVHVCCTCVCTAGAWHVNELHKSRQRPVVGHEVGSLREILARCVSKERGGKEREREREREREGEREYNYM